MIPRSCLLLMCLLFMVPYAGATDEEWRAFERSFDYNPPQVLREAEQDLKHAGQRGDKHAELKAIRKLTYSGKWSSLDSPESIQVQRGIALARELRDDESLAWLLSVRSAIEMRAGRAAEAEALLQQATTIADRHGLTRMHGYILMWKALPLDERRESDTLAAVTKAYSLFDSVQDKRGMAFALHWLANMYLHNNGAGRVGDAASKQTLEEQLEKVIEYETRVLALLDPEVYRDRARNAYTLMGMAYGRLKDYNRATNELEKALRIARSYPDQRAVGILEFLLAQALNEAKRHQDALHHIDTALPILAQSEDTRPTVFMASFIRADILAHLGRKQESIEAFSRVEAMVPAMEKLGIQRIVRDYYLRAAEAYALLEEHAQAYRQMTAFLEYHRNATATNNRKAAEQLTVKFDVQLKEAENALLRSQQKEAETNRIALMLALAVSVMLLGAVWFNLRRRAAAARIEAVHHRELAAAEAAANEAKRTFLANMSHELRSPLNVVLGFTQLLMRKSELPEDARQDLAIVYNSGQHLYTLINQVLDLSKIEAGHLTLNESDFDLYALMDELADMFIIPANQKGLHLLVENDPHVPQYLHADALKLRQVLINLLNNAVKFTSTGSIALHVARVDSIAGMLSFAVSDTGPGIAPDEMGKLGGAFVQAQAGKTAKEGTGLGLAISASFVQLMGGSELKFSSRLGEGTTIGFDLPVQVAEAATQVPGRAGPVMTGLALGQPCYRILVADDRPESRQLLTRLLTPLGFEVREAENGEAALGIWDEWSPHLVWMDMRMPVMDGREAARRIRATDKGKATVIIALTASAFDSEREDILADGCDDLLRKPFREDELFDMMHKYLGVQFIYEGAEVDTQPELERLVASDLPEELRTQLRQALAELNADGVEAVIELIRMHDDALATVLAQTASRFEYGRMQEWVERNATV